MAEILNLGASNPINAFSHFQIQRRVMMIIFNAITYNVLYITYDL